jgi:Na+/citrate or Na+/malate symporter
VGYQHPVAFEDLARGFRAFVVGTTVMVAGLLARFHPAEALTLAILVTMLLDLLRMVQASLRLDAVRTRQIFSTWQPNGKRLLGRTVLLAFLSVLVLSFCVHDVKAVQGILPAPLLEEPGARGRW